jgi:hypothetical protein
LPHKGFFPWNTISSVSREAALDFTDLPARPVYLLNTRFAEAAKTIA